ncbi:MAG: flagellar hook-basal body complex protein, partial [Janthinobacterium lividum]
MSLLGAMNTAVSGLSAQSAAFSNISDNVANSQTTGFKGTDTSFIDYLTTSTATENQSGSVSTRPDYTNDVQGSISTSTDATAMAIDGQGFFAVSQATGTTTAGSTLFNPTTEYTRDGDFTLNKSGYLVNSAGEYLNGWPVDSTGAVVQGSVAPIQINQSQDAPVATTTVSLSANLPAGGTTTDSSQTTVYDAEGGTHTMELAWSPGTDANTWDLSVTLDGGTATTGTATFDTNGVLTNFTPTGGTAQATNGEAASLTVPAASGDGTAITVGLGTIGGTSGVTQFAGTTYNPRSIDQNGTAAGNFSSISIQSNGDVVANYDNGASKTLAQVPVVTFADADALQR